jgi:hypothetical protein
MDLTSSGIPSWTERNLELLATEWLRTGTSPLSPYPKAYRANLEWRATILRRAKNDPVYRAKVKELFHRDPLFAFNAFFYTLDVRRKPEHHQPFATYFYQDLAILNLVAAIREKRDLPWEKSRDMGASWKFVGTYTWFWLAPEGGSDFLLGSRIENYVDKKGDPRTLFEKIRYLLYRLPKWLMPKGFQRNKHDNYMKIVNPETGSSLTGESNNANFGTGGRYSGVLLDEFPKWEGTDTAAWTSLGDATPSRHPIGTPFGAGGKHYEIVTEPGAAKLVLHWSLHPTKGNGLCCSWPKKEDRKFVDFLHWKGLTSPWYEAEIRRRTKREISQELDIDYIGAGKPVFEDDELERILELRQIEKQILKVFQPILIGERYEWKLQEVAQEDLPDLDGYIAIYELPKHDSLEVYGCDVAEGKGEEGDYCVIKGMNRKTRSMIAHFYSQTNEVQLAKIIYLLDGWVRSFKKSPDQYPWWVIETVGPGLATFDMCLEWGVSNLFMTPKFDSAKDTISYTKGMKTSTQSKNKGISLIREWLREAKGWVDSRFCREATTFVHKENGTPGAKEGCHDDEVAAWWLTQLGDMYLPAIDYFEEDKLLPIERARLEMQKAPKPITEKSIEDHCLETIEQLRAAQQL